MAAPKAIQVIKENVRLRPERYDGYQADLVGLLADALAAADGGLSTIERRRELTGAIKAKASTIGTTL